ASMAKLSYTPYKLQVTGNCPKCKSPIKAFDVHIVENLTDRVNTYIGLFCPICDKKYKKTPVTKGQPVDPAPAVDMYCICPVPQYYCPIHPWVVSNASGNCSVGGEALVRINPI
ncbi:MAG: hypothetical protein ABSA76_12555, partial [Bacteroidales bacterium]